jgi:CubicO group peptidase (beta-lactamase class C family)
MDVDRLEARVQAEVDAGRILGAALAVLAGGEVVSARGFGATTVAPEGVPVTPATLFCAASIAKTILATAVVRLVERGQLDLDAPVLGYLPGFAFSDPALGARVTLRHLLSHTSGLAAAGKDFGPPDRDALAHFVHEQLARYAFVAEPGRAHLYSNTAICLAGYVAEVVARTPYRDLAAELVFEPLGMTRTTFDHAVAMTHRLALAHERPDGELRAVHRWPDNRSGDPSGFASAPVVDLARLALVHLNGGDGLLSPASVAQMQTRWADRRVRAASHPVAHLYEGYGLGLMLGRYRGARVVRHGGRQQSFSNFLDLLPDHDRGFVLLTNYSEGPAQTECALALYDLLLGLPEGDAASRAVLLPAADAPPEGDGTYLSVPLGRLATLARRGAHLELRQRARTHPLTPVAPGAYFYEEEGVRVPVELDAPDYLFVGGYGYRRHAPGPAPDPSRWPRFVGEYADPTDLGDDPVFRVTLEDGRLRLDDEELVPLGPRSFLSDHGLVEVEADERALQVGGATRYLRRG